SHFTDPPTPRTCPLSLHDALPISIRQVAPVLPFRRSARAGHQLFHRPGGGGHAEAGGHHHHRAEAAGAVQLHALAHEALALAYRSEEHTSELQSRENLVCRLLLEK